MKIIKLVWWLGLASGVLLQPAHAQDGSEIYTTRCAACHEMPVAEAERPPPTRGVLADIPPNTIYNALSQGVMRMQATGLSNAEMRSVSEFLTGAPVVELALEITTNLCPANPPMRNPALSPAWNGWGPDHRNNRFARDGGVNAANLSRLRLKWVYGLPGEDQPRAQPAIRAGSWRWRSPAR